MYYFPLHSIQAKMFDALASKIGEAQQAFADGLGNLDALNMDR